MHYSNKHHRPGVEYQINDLVYLSTKNLALPKDKAQKFMPRFIGPYKVLKAMNNSLNITVELRQELKDRRMNPTFHTSLVQPYIKNNDILFPRERERTPKYTMTLGTMRTRNEYHHFLYNNHLVTKLLQCIL